MREQTIEDIFNHGVIVKGYKKVIYFEKYPRMRD
jgi:hypothetical protein